MENNKVKRAYALGLKSGQTYFNLNHPRVYRLENSNCMVVEIVNVGAAIRSIRRDVDVILG